MNFQTISRFFAVLALATVGCGGEVPGGGSQTRTTESVGGANGSGSEATWFDDKLCWLHFGGTPSATAEQFAIWNFGHAERTTNYNDGRNHLYAVIPGTQHVVPGYPAFNHDHVVDAAPGTVGYDTMFDVYLVVPGPNFDPVTYHGPESAAEMKALIDAGVLYGPLTLPQAGFAPLAVQASVHCN